MSKEKGSDKQDAIEVSEHETLEALHVGQWMLTVY